MQPSKKLKTNPGPIKPLITEEVQTKPKNKKKTPPTEAQPEEVPQVENPEVKKSQIARNREVKNFC